jgi:hypothetical protein
MRFATAVQDALICRSLFLLLVCVLGFSPSKAQDFSRKTMDNFTYDVHEALRYYLSDPLFFITNHELDEHVHLQFGLKKIGEPDVKRLHFTPDGDTLFLEFTLRTQAYDGRLDWSLDTKLARFSHHAPFGPVLTLEVRVCMPILWGQSPTMRPDVRIKWDGERIIHVMRWEIDLPFFAEPTFRKNIMAVVEVVHEKITRYNEHIVGGRNEWDHNSLEFHILEQKMAPPPPEIVQHRNLRIQSKRRVVEDLSMDGEWHTRVWLRPHFGIYGEVLTDFFFSIRGDQITDYRYEFLRSKNLSPEISLRRNDLSLIIQEWMEFNEVHAVFLVLLKTDPPYDYVLQVKGDNPEHQRSFFLYALSKNDLALRVTTERYKSVIVRLKRIG